MNPNFHQMMNVFMSIYNHVLTCLAQNKSTSTFSSSDIRDNLADKDACIFAADTTHPQSLWIAYGLWNLLLSMFSGGEACKLSTDDSTITTCSFFI